MFATHAAAVILCVKTVIDAIAVNINPYNLAVVVYPVRLGALVWATSGQRIVECSVVAVAVEKAVANVVGIYVIANNLTVVIDVVGIGALGLAALVSGKRIVECDVVAVFKEVAVLLPRRSG